MSEEIITKNYELAFLLKDEGAKAVITRLLEQHQAEPVSEGAFRRIALAYPIKKQDQAFFGFLRFRLPTATTPSLDHDLKMNEAVLRHMILEVPAASPVTPRVMPSSEAAPAFVKSGETSPSPLEPQPQAAVAGPLSNEELERKIEEILQ